jgi:hypothetical protein
MVSPRRPATLFLCLVTMTCSVKARAQSEIDLQNDLTKHFNASSAVQPHSITFAERDRVLAELHDTMSNLTNLMDKHAMMTSLQLRTIAGIVRKLSQNIQALSQPLANIDAATTLATIRENNRRLNATIDELQAELNEN